MNECRPVTGVHLILIHKYVSVETVRIMKREIWIIDDKTRANRHKKKKEAAEDLND